MKTSFCTYVESQLIDNSQDVKNWREKASVEERRELYICVLYHYHQT